MDTASTSRFSTPPHCFLAFVQKQRALPAQSFPLVFSACKRTLVLTQSCWWVSTWSLGCPEPDRHSAAPFWNGQFSTHAFPHLAFPSRLSRGGSRGRSLSLVGVGDIDPSTCGLEDLKPQISYCARPCKDEGGALAPSSCQHPQCREHRICPSETQTCRRAGSPLPPTHLVPLPVTYVVGISVV